MAGFAVERAGAATAHVGGRDVVVFAGCDYLGLAHDPAVVDALARGLANKFLHAPLSALNTAGDAERAELIALFQRVYRLHEPPVDGH